MAQELLYTSAPRGLKSGSRGFCTVEATTGLPPALVTALEGLSGYRHVAPPGDPANPTAYSHVTLSLGGRTYSVLSRVADAGADYTGRTNKLAHHVALDAAERPQGGPAWLLGRPGFLKTAFNGEPRTLPSRSAPQGDRTPAVCQTWKAATGDAGWAGVLAEAYLADPNRSAYLVVPPGLDVRLLFEEAIALLPTDRRWGVTFTTFYTSLPQGVTCLWRAVSAGSKEEHESKRFVQALRLSLTEPLETANGGVLVECARSGRMPVVPVMSVAWTPPAKVSHKASQEEPTKLDLVPGVENSLPHHAIEPLMRPPALHRRSRGRAVLWVIAAAACLAVIAAPIVLMIQRSTTPIVVHPQERTESRHESVAPQGVAAGETVAPPVEQGPSEGGALPQTGTETPPPFEDSIATAEAKTRPSDAETAAAPTNPPAPDSKDIPGNAGPAGNTNASGERQRETTAPSADPAAVREDVKPQPLEGQPAAQEAEEPSSVKRPLKVTANRSGDDFVVVGLPDPIADGSSVQLHLTKEAEDRHFRAVQLSPHQIEVREGEHADNDRNVKKADLALFNDVNGQLTLTITPKQLQYGNVLRDELMWCPLGIQSSTGPKLLVWWTAPAPESKPQMLSNRVVALPLPAEYAPETKIAFDVELTLTFPGPDPQDLTFKGPSRGELSSLEYKQRLESQVANSLKGEVGLDKNPLFTEAELTSIAEGFAKAKFSLDAGVSGREVKVSYSPETVLKSFQRAISADAKLIYDTATTPDQMRAIPSPFGLAAVVGEKGPQFVRTTASKVETFFNNKQRLENAATRRTECRKALARIIAIAQAAEDLRGAEVTASRITYIAGASSETNQKDVVVWEFLKR